MTASLPDIAMISANTADSRSVTVVYDINQAAITQPLTFGVYRSATTTLDSSATTVGSVTINPGASGTLDAAGLPALSLGHHEVTLPIAGGLPINPSRPDVLVVANPDNAVAESNTANNTASFHTYVLGIITHGGVQPKGWKQGPPWERRMANDLTAQGYDAVIPFNWVAASNHAGSAVKQVPRLVANIEQAAAQFPAGAPVDVHFIGHSEGAVINSQAIKMLNADGWPANLAAGYLKVTMLDPHAANSSLKGQQYSVSGNPLGDIARLMINNFQSSAKDPLPVVTPNVQSAEVFFQHTPINRAETNNGVYNLWGQVPVKGNAAYFNLSAPGISHSGTFGVQDWYRLNVVPTLGGGESLINEVALTATESTPPTTSPAAPDTPVTYTGRAAPGAKVRLLGSPASGHKLNSLSSTDAGPDGTWTITTRPLPPGKYRVVAVSNIPTALSGKPEFYKPTAWLPTLVLTPTAPIA